MSKETIFRVSFISQGEVYEVYARNVSQGGLFGFIEIEELEERIADLRRHTIADPEKD